MNALVTAQAADVDAEPFRDYWKTGSFVQCNTIGLQAHSKSDPARLNKGLTAVVHRHTLSDLPQALKKIALCTCWTPAVT